MDGATFDLIKPWAKEGKLPTLNRFLDEGVHGELKSTFPPLTAAAWTSFMSGKNPGKHALYDFIEPKSDSYEVRYTNARSRLTTSIWQILSEYGLRVGIINVPMTYPPEPVNGYVISGLDAPEGNGTITFPPGLHCELEKMFGKVSPSVRYLGYLKTDERREKVLRLLSEMDEHYLKMAQYLMKRDPVDLMMLVLTSTDSTQHFFWHYMDRNHPHHNPHKSTRFGNAILKAYQRADGIIERLTVELPEETTVILMSDHGFRPTSGRIVYLNRFLQELGLLKLRGQKSRRFCPGVLFDQLIKSGDLFLRSTLSPRQKERVAQLFPVLRNKWESHNSGLSNIDWEHTKAYCYEMVTCPSGIWVNLNGARPQGIVQPGPEYDDLLRFITQKLYELRDPLTGTQLVTKVYRKDEIYTGPYLDRAPDLTVAWWEGITFVGKPSFSGQHRNGGESKVVEYIGEDPLASGEWTGNHAVNGILLMKGKDLRGGARLNGAEIIDVAPTLLYLLGVPGFEAMDGRVLTEAFKDEYLQSHGFDVQSSGVAGYTEFSDQTYSDAESILVAQRLRDLGYLE